MIKIHIRRAINSDAVALSSLICENASKCLKPHYSKEQWNIFLTYYSPTVMSEKIETQVIFCALGGKTIVGCIGLHDDYVVGFYTRLENRNRGIGKTLMTHLETYAKATGLSQLRLAASPEGLAFYYKNGWRKVKDVVIEHYGVGFNETLMKKELLA